MYRRPQSEDMRGTVDLMSLESQQMLAYVHLETGIRPISTSSELKFRGIYSTNAAGAVHKARSNDILR